MPTTGSEPIRVLVASVMQIMPELQNLCSTLTSPMSLDHLEMDSSATSCVWQVSSMPCEHLETPEFIVSVVPIVDDIVLVVPIDDVDVPGVLGPSLKSLLVDDNHIKKYNDFYDFLDKWETHQPGSEHTSACLLKEKPNNVKSKRRKRKKSGANQTASMVS
ncbi:hypothetical protein D1007_41178 [Hordeum vulgare]|nr:hypothetical protein D1007_41178 [Hordeum vulgare]